MPDAPRRFAGNFLHSAFFLYFLLFEACNWFECPFSVPSISLTTATVILVRDPLLGGKLHPPRTAGETLAITNSIRGGQAYFFQQGKREVFS